MLRAHRAVVWRAHRAVVWLALLALAGAACSGSESGSDLSAKPTKAGPERADKLTIALARDWGPLNLFVGADEKLAELVYDKLLAPNPHVEEPQPWLAEEVSRVDPSTWEVKVRDGVTWHDGKPLTANDVRFTFEYMKQAPTGRWTHHVSDIPAVDKVETIDTNRVRFTCAFACPDLGAITLADLPIIPQHLWEGLTEPRKVTSLPVGTGPYRLVEYNPTSGYRFEANEDYFAGAPVVDELVMPVIPDPSSAFTALRSGEIDAAARGLPPELLDEFSKASGVKVVNTSPLQFVEMRMNYGRSPLDVPEFRRALSRAIDRKQLLATVVLGQGRAATKGYPHPDSPWTKPGLSTPSDAAEARRLLDDLGFADRDGNGTRERVDGSPLAFTIKVTGSEPTHVRAAELVAEDLGKVGIKAGVERIDAGSIANLFQSRDFDLSVGEIGPHGVADPTQFIMSHRSGYLWQAPKLPYPEWDALFEEWKATTNVEVRTAVLFRMQELFNKQPTSIPLFYPDEHWAFRPGSYDGWVETPGYGIVHKWSLLPDEVSRKAGAVKREFR